MEKNILWAILIITVVTSGSHRSEKSDILKGFVKLVVNRLNIIEVKNINPFLRWRLLLIALYNIHYLCIKMRVTYYK